MKLGLLAWLLCGALRVAAQATPLDFGHVDSLRSRSLQATRGLWVYVPPADPSGVFAPKRYPVLYLLDGDLHFASVLGLVQQLSAVNGNTICPEMIIVGIPSPFRTRTHELTPTHATTRWDGREDPTLASSGGGAPFQRFLEAEVIPYIESRYPTAPYRLLVGHSLGGLTVLSTMATNPQLFNAYLAIEPSAWWDKQVIVSRLAAALANPSGKPRKLFLAVANTLPVGRDTVRVRQDTSRSTQAMRAELAVVDLLRQHAPASLRWQWRYYPEETHGSVPLRAEYDALHFFFQHQEVPLPTSVTAPAFTAAALRQQYQTLSQQFGYPVHPPEEVINMYAWACMQRKLPEKAYSLFHLNLLNYPTSLNAHTSLGAFYEQQGQPKQALPYYTQALALRDTPELRQKVQGLQTKK